MKRGSFGDIVNVNKE